MLRHGLLPTSALLTLFELSAAARRSIEGERRTASVVLAHPAHGSATITDNLPLIMPSLAACLDDRLRASDWLRMLNERVFFWPDEAGLARLLGARLNRRRDREVLVFDTLSLARRHAERIDLCAINSGATMRRAARRGLSTFVPLHRYDYETWRRLRGRRDRLCEVTVRGGVPDVADHLVEVRLVASS